MIRTRGRRGVNGTVYLAVRGALAPSRTRALVRVSIGAAVTGMLKPERSRDRLRRLPAKVVVCKTPWEDPTGFGAGGGNQPLISVRLGTAQVVTADARPATSSRLRVIEGLSSV